MTAFHMFGRVYTFNYFYFYTFCLWSSKLVQYFCLHATNDIQEFGWLITWLRCVLCVGMRYTAFHTLVDCTHLFISYFYTLSLWNSKLVQYFCLHDTNDIQEFGWLTTWLRGILCVREWGTQLFTCSIDCTHSIAFSVFISTSFVFEAPNLYSTFVFILLMILVN